MLMSDQVEEQVQALKKLNMVVDYQWHEISEELTRIEALIDLASFPEKELAASVASKVFYYLNEHDEALKLALEAGQHFDISQDTKYVNTMVHKCIDVYTAKRITMASDNTVVIDPKMEAIVNRKFEQCYQ